MTESPKPNPFTDVNPHRPRAMPELANRRPGGLTAICIVAVVLGVLGLFAGGLKGVNVLFGAEMQQAFGSFGAITPEQAQTQQEMQAAIAAEITRFRLVNGILCVSQLMLCGALVFSGLKTLALKGAWRKLLLAVCACMIVYEIGQLVAFIFQQLAMGPIMELYMPRIMKSSPGNNAGAEKFGQAIARMSIIAGVVVQCVWTLIKFIFYAVAISYLCKAKVIALFDPSPAQHQPQSEPT